jgi:hypothetical protein
MTFISEQIDAIFDDSSVSTAATDVKEVVKELERAQQYISKLENRLEIAKKSLCGELGLAIRRTLPSLNVAVNNSGCKVGYKSKHLLLIPDPVRGIWQVKSKDNRFSRRFYKVFATRTVMSDDLNKLAEAVVA